MKTLKKLPLFLIILLAAAACTKKNPDHVPPAPNFSVMLDNKLWQGYATADMGTCYTTITATNTSDGTKIALNFAGTGAGTCFLGRGVNNTGEYQVTDDQNNWSFIDIYSHGDTGKIEINSIDGNTLSLSGNFNFTATENSTHNVHIFSNGQMNRIPITSAQWVSATVDGKPWFTSNVNYDDKYSTIRISALKKDSTIISFDLPKNLEPGHTYHLSQDAFGYNGFYAVNLGARGYNSQSGTLTINTMNASEIAGSFSFTGQGIDNEKETVNISGGRFDIHKQ